MQDRKKLFVLLGVLIVLGGIAAYVYLGGGGADTKPATAAERQAAERQAADIQAAQQAERAKLPPTPEPPPVTATHRGAVTTGGK